MSLNSSHSSLQRVYQVTGQYIDVVASEERHQETVNGEDIAMTSLGFQNYVEVLKIYLAKYRQVNAYVLWF